MTAIESRPASAGTHRRATSGRAPWSHVLLACDGGPGSAAAGRRALEIAVRDGADLTVIVARQLAPPHEVGADALPPAVEQLLDTARSAGLEARGEVRHGASGAQILEAAQEYDADLIVIGRHGPAAGGSFAVANCGYVVTHSDRPVLVVQPWAPAVRS